MSAFQDVLIARVNEARAEARKLRIELVKTTRQRDHARAQLEACSDERTLLRRRIIALEIAQQADTLDAAFDRLASL